MTKFLLQSLKALLAFFAMTLLLIGCAQRKLLYFPSHDKSEQFAASGKMMPWLDKNQGLIGYARIPANPNRVWLIMHGNGGQAAHRAYMLAYFKPTDAVYVLEYPGYGDRAGDPSKTAFNQAAETAYQLLAMQYGRYSIHVLGESIGSGPASFLATMNNPPARIVLLVPFDLISNVAQEKFPFLPVKLMLLDQWNNIESLKNYSNRLDIWAATHDQVIPTHHAKNLAKNLPKSHFHEFEGSHNWSEKRLVSIDE
jgi:uncharacterized protein